ncbi:MAG: hypothetical protein ACD_2C00110G0001 [uncultured bacterium (gcode 4)]|uniref:Uncharacterized protein n=1 Tax=uncultured bacterium (gcode 4) TaxID=1234023 RepID=K2FET8_9BACT|nr:MAG: hypothetical protein ACD_2C00110G0001 [uncultured bacterium (gcode 4)]
MININDDIFPSSRGTIARWRSRVLSLSWNDFHYRHLRYHVPYTICHFERMREIFNDKSWIPPHFPIIERGLSKIEH